MDNGCFHSWVLPSYVVKQWGGNVRKKTKEILLLYLSMLGGGIIASLTLYILLLLCRVVK